MEVIEYMSSEEGHGTDPSQGIEHQDSFELTAGDVILVQSGDFVKVVNESEHDQLTYLRVFDREGWRVEPSQDFQILLIISKQPHLQSKYLFGFHLNYELKLSEQTSLLFQ